LRISSLNVVQQSRLLLAFIYRRWIFGAIPRTTVGNDQLKGSSMQSTKGRILCTEDDGGTLIAGRCWNH